MKKIKLNLIYALSFLSFVLMPISDAHAANIPPDVSAPPQVDEAMNFTAPGTFTIGSGYTFTGALTNDAAGLGTLELNTGSTYIGAVGTGISPLSTITLNGNATIIGATSAVNFNLGQNTLTNDGALNLPVGLVINTRVISNALFGHIAASGANSLAGNVTVNVDASGIISLTTGAPLFIISADGTTSGRTVTVTSNNVLYSFLGNNLNGNVTIIPTFNPAVIPPSGVGSVFTELNDIAAQNPDSDIATVMSALANLTSVEEINAALAQFNPIADGALPQVSFDAMKQFHNIWSKHMGYGRCVYATDCCNDCCEHSCQPKNSCDCCCTPINCNCVKNRYELWADAFGYAGHQDARSGFNSYNARIYGGMIGFQAPINRVLSIGFGGGYADSHVRRKNVSDRNSTIKTYDATAYLSYDSNHWYMDSAFSFDYNQYKDSRSIEFPGISRVARAHYNGQEYSALIALGYRYYYMCSILSPIASLQYSYLNVNKHQESGAGDLDLYYKRQHFNFLESSLGFKLSRPIQTIRGAFVPEVHALWLYDFFGNGMNPTTSFSGVASQAGTFSTGGKSLDRNHGNIGAGLTYISCSRLAIEVVYNYEFSKTYHSNEGLIKITKRF